MKKQRLGDALRTYYGDKELPGEDMERLLAMADVHAPTRAWYQLAPRALLAAAAVFLLATASLLWVARQGTAASGDQLARSIAAEIALNHNKRLDVEFRAASYPELEAHMDKLDFALVAGQRLVGRKLRLVGARYCSIQDQLAAQIRLVDADGQALTLYQSRPIEALGEDVRTLTVDGVEVEMWQEQGVSLGLAATDQ